MVYQPVEAGLPTVGLCRTRLIESPDFLGVDASVARRCVIDLDTGEIVHRKRSASTPEIVAWAASLPVPRIAPDYADPTRFGLLDAGGVVAALSHQVAPPSTARTVATKSRAAGGTIKTGNFRVRRSLVEATWSSRRDYRPTLAPMM